MIRNFKGKTLLGCTMLLMGTSASYASLNEHTVDFSGNVKASTCAVSLPANIQLASILPTDMELSSTGAGRATYSTTDHPLSGASSWLTGCVAGEEITATVTSSTLQTAGSKTIHLWGGTIPNNPPTSAAEVRVLLTSDAEGNAMPTKYTEGSATATPTTNWPATGYPIVMIARGLTSLTAADTIGAYRSTLNVNFDYK